MVEVSIQVDRDTLEAFRKQMNRYVTELKKTPEDAVRIGALTLLEHLRTQTKQAPQRRKVRTDPEFRRKRDAHGNRRFLMEKWNRKTDAVEYVPIYAQDLATAKQHKLTFLKYRGLAKASWGWVAQKISPKKKVPYSGRRPVREVFTVDMRGRSNDYEITINNKLDYIGLALKGGESAAVSTAMRKATSKMFGRIEQRLKGKIK